MPVQIWDDSVKDFRIKDISQLVHNLTTTLGREGYAFKQSNEIRPGGFVRVYVGKNLDPGDFDTYLDLRMGPPSPRGNTVEMASATPETYGVPGFTRHIMGQSQLTNVLSTFSDYVRSIHSAAVEQGRTPQEMAWPVYQKGYAPLQYPGSGAVVGPAATSGKREFAARTVRYFHPQGTPVQEYVKGVVGKMRSKAPIRGLEGYGIEQEKHKAWVPATTMRFGDEVALGRPPEKWSKSLGRIGLEATDIAKEAYYEVGKRLEPIVPTEPTMGRGVRTGWTRSSIVLPGETKTRVGQSVQIAIADQPDLPGAVYTSPGANIIRQGAEEVRELYSKGEPGYTKFRFGISTIDSLRELVQDKGLSFHSLEGRKVEGGTGKFRIGKWQEPHPTKEGKTKAEFVEIERKGYDIRLEKPTINIPRYYDPTVEGGQFSNIPIMHEGKEMTTDALVEEVQQKLGNRVNVSQISALQSDKGAEVYVDVPIGRMTDQGIKGAGIKGYGYQVPEDMMMEFLGEKKPQYIDMFTGESKIDPRILATGFGNMNMLTQLDFLKEALPTKTPRQQKAVENLQSYVREQYSEGGLTGKIEADEMGRIYGASTGKRMSGDMLFGGMITNLLDMYTEGEVKGKHLRREYLIGLPREQDFGAVPYSKGQMQERKRLIEELPPEAQKMLTFEKFRRGKGGSIDRLTDTLFGEDAPGMYMHKFKVPGEGTSISIQAMASSVSEYPFNRGFVNAKAIMSLMQRYPQSAMEMGLTGDAGEGAKWLGATDPKIGKVQPHVKGWNEMAGWLGFAADLRLRGENMSVPRGTIPLTPQLGAMIGDAYKVAKDQPTTEMALKKYREALRNIDPEVAGLPDDLKGVKLDESFLLEENSMTLLPRVSSIEAIESYGEGMEKGQSKTYLGKRYFSLLDEALQTVDTLPGARIAQMRTESNRFYSRVEGAFFPGGSRSKKIFRHITGAHLPGMRGGRYQGFPQGEFGEAYASDSWIKRMLSYNKYAKRGEVDSIVKYLNESPGAYLPVFTQRYPDISGEHVWMPMKLRTKKAFEATGVPTPSGFGARDVLFFDPFANTIMGGDFDADPSSSKVPRLYENEGRWEMSKAGQAEWDRGMDFYYSDVAKTRKNLLEGMFGERAIDLDPERVALGKYYENARKDAPGSLRERLAGVKKYKAVDNLMATYAVANAKGGMGAAYNRRTMTEDIADAVLTMNNSNMYKKAYEAGAMPYQMYLDQMPESRGGLTQLETTLNSFGVYNFAGEPGDLAYNIGFRTTLQGKEAEFGAKTGFENVGGRGMVTGQRMFLTMMRNIAKMPSWKEADAKLAWGWSTPGNAQKVFEALDDPEAFLGARGVRDISRENVMQLLYREGGIGFNSPYYTSMAYRAVERLTKKQPSYAEDPSVKIPWLGTGMKSIKDIVASEEYQLINIADRLLLKGSDVVRPHEMMKLKKLTERSGARLSKHFSGIVADWERATGGIAPDEQMTAEMSQRLEFLNETYAEKFAKQVPVVNASEFGALLGSDVPERVTRAGWKPVPQRGQREAGYQAGLRAFGAGEVLLSDPLGKGGVWQKVQMRTAGGQSTLELFEGGETFEKEFAKRTSLIRTGGQLKKEEKLDFDVGGIKIRGEPDFIGYNPVTKKVIIEDTKSPALSEKEEGKIDEVASRKRTMSTRNYYQQLLYAYGMEKKAAEMDPGDWLGLIRSWGRFDDKTIGDMQEAAAAGRFQIKLRPGFAKKGFYRELEPIDIEYGAAERADVESAAAGLSSGLFSGQSRGALAREIHAKLMNPTGVPAGLEGAYRRRPGMTPNMSEWRYLDEFAKATTRMAGGGMMQKEEGKRIRVGEGGPEELIVHEEGIEIVPTQDLTESRQARGEDVSQEGYMGSRMAESRGIVFGQEDAEIPEVPATPAPATPDLSDFGTLVKTFTESSQLQVAKMNEVIAALGETAETIGQGTTIRTAGGRAPSDTAIQMSIGKNIQDFGAGYTEFAEFQRKASDIMIGAYKKAGLGEQVAGMKGALNAADLLAYAPTMGVERELYEREFRRQGLMEQAPRIQKAYGAVKGFENLALKGVDVGARLIPGSPSSKVFSQYQSMLGIMPGAEGTEAEQARADEQIHQAGGVAGYIQASRGQLKAGILEGADVATMSKYFKAVQRATDTQEQFTDAQMEGIDVETKAVAARKAQLKVTEMERGFAYQEAQKAVPQLYEGGKFIGWERATALDEAGGLTAEDRQAFAVAEQARGRLGVTRQAIARAEGGPGTAMMKGVGRISRRLLGGFGLMYMQSIGRLITGAGTLGYAESMQEQMVAEQAQGAVSGAYAPTMTPEMRLARARAGYAGYGQRALAGLQAGMMEERPGLTTALGLGFTGLVGAGAASYFAGMIPGVTAAALGPIALGAGALAIGGMAATQAIGAYQEPELSAMALAEDPGQIFTAARWGRMIEQHVTGGAGGEMAQLQPIYESMLAEQSRRQRTGEGGTMREYLQRTTDLTKYEQTRAVSQWARKLATDLGISDQAAQQVVGWMEDYGINLSEGVGGGVEQFGAALETGTDFQALAYATRVTPYMTLGEARGEVAAQLEQWDPRRAGLPTRREQGALGIAGQRLTQLGNLAPDISGRALQEFMQNISPEVMADPDFEMLAGRAARERRRQTMGADYQQPWEYVEEYQGMTPEMRTETMRMDRLRNIMDTAFDNLEATFSAMVGVIPDMTRFQGMEPMEMGVIQQQAQQGMAIGQQLITAGLAPGEAQLAGGALGGLSGMDPRTSRMYQGLLGGNRASFLRMAQQDPFRARQMAGMTVAGAGGAPINLGSMFMAGVNAQGQVSGLPYGAENLATPIYSSLEMQGQIFGMPGAWEGQGFDTGLIGALTEGGTRGGQRYQMQVQYGQQMAMAGIQARQLALQREYQPQFWAIQDQQRELGYAQQGWGFQMQQTQLDESRQYFQQTTGLQQRQMQMQRGWAREDWAFQDQTRAMQWGWRQEDFAEQVRFMTGRERRLAERGMGREVIMHDLEGEQIDKKRARQKDMWSLEDERFDIQMGHQNTLFDLQQENLDKQREFFEERKRLETELTELQREYWEKNMQIQEDAMGINAGYAAQMHAMQLTMLALTEHVEDANAEASRFNEDSMLGMYDILIAIDPVFKGYLDDLEKQMKLMEGEEATSEPYRSPTQRQYGGRVYPGETYSILEGGTAELFKPDMTGTIIPLDDPWGASIVSPSGGGGGGPIRIILKVGDDTLIDRILDRVDQEILL